MSRRRRVVLFLGVVLGLVAAVGLAAVYLVDAERLKETALAEARSATGYALEAGPASVHWSWSGAGIRVEAFRMASPDSSQRLEVERADFYLKLLPLIRKEVELRELVLHRPRLTLVEAASARDGFPPGHREVGSPALAILAVESWTVEDGGFLRRAADSEFTLTGLDLTGGFRWTPETGGRGTATGSATGGRYDGEAGAWPVPPLDARVEFGMNAAADSVFVPALVLGSGDLRVHLAGDYHRVGDIWTGALEGSAEPANFAEVRGLLPAETDSALAGMELDGRFALDRLRVELTGAGETLVTGLVNFEAGRAKMAGAPLGLTGAAGRVRFEPGLILLEDGAGRLGEEPITFTARVEGQKTQRFSASLATSLPGPVLSGLLPPEARVALESGEAAVDLTLSGPLPPEPNRLPRVQGRVEFRDLAGTARDLPLRAGRGEILFRDGGAAVNNLGASWGSSDFQLNGVIADVTDPRLRFTLSSEMLDLDELMPAEEPGGEAGTAAAEEDDSPTVVGIPAMGWVEIQRLRLRGEDLHDLRVQVDLGLAGLFLNELRARYHEGTLAGRLDVRPGGDGSTWRYEGDLTLVGVPAGPLVAAVAPGGGRLEGLGDADLVVEGTAVAGRDPRETLTVEGDVSLREGAFVNLPALQSLAEALQIKEGMGERWPFHDLWMRFAVRGGRLVLDTLRVDQTGLAWRLGGSMGLAGDLRLDGTLRADPARVAVPTEVRLLAALITEADGRIPVDFKIGGSVTEPRLGLDWTGLAKRAAQRAQEEEAERLRKQLEETITDPETLKRLKDLLKGKGSGG